MGIDCIFFTLPPWPIPAPKVRSCAFKERRDFAELAGGW